jgi:hypothetical protein
MLTRVIKIGKEKQRRAGERIKEDRNEKEGCSSFEEV